MTVLSKSVSGRLLRGLAAWIVCVQVSTAQTPPLPELPPDSLPRPLKVNPSPAGIALERRLPNLCADRIQYIVHTGLICDLLSKEEAKAIINDIQFIYGFILDLF